MNIFVVLGLLLLINLLAFADAVRRAVRRKPFERVVADIRLTVDPKTRIVRCHTEPTDEQLAVIEEWVKDPKAFSNAGWHVVEPL